MDEKSLLRIALAISLVGMAALFFVSSSIDASERTISQIDSDDLGDDVKLVGRISKISQTGSVSFLELTQPSTMDVIVFNKENMTLNEGDYVEIIGEIDDYEGKLEIIGQRIRKIS
ncbi:MAG TPA: OB-fold nucleic acid binding domain-containing protein [Candidatus Nanoarchaeia archaeon]|nr:OB-fold nucleic acid binding domain-containing protein [Candidatus Nanoarchaeia archaeon]